MTNQDNFLNYLITLCAGIFLSNLDLRKVLFNPKNFTIIKTAISIIFRNMETTGR